MPATAAGKTVPEAASITGQQDVQGFGFKWVASVPRRRITLTGKHSAPGIVVLREQQQRRSRLRLHRIATATRRIRVGPRQIPA